MISVYRLRANSISFHQDSTRALLLRMVTTPLRMEVISQLLLYLCMIMLHDFRLFQRRCLVDSLLLYASKLSSLCVSTLCVCTFAAIDDDDGPASSVASDNTRYTNNSTSTANNNNLAPIGGSKKGNSLPGVGKKRVSEKLPEVQ